MIHPRAVHWPFWVSVGCLVAACAGCRVAPATKSNIILGTTITQPVFTYKVFIGAPIEKVWEAITTAEIVSKYYLAPLTKIEMKKGGAMVYGEGDPPMIAGTITELESGKKLVHTFVFGHRPDDPPSRVTYELEAIGQMCSLTLTHDKFADDTPTYSDISGGWPTILSELKSLLETGKGLPWPKQEKQQD